MEPDDFDLPQQSPYTPEGQIEAAGRFARGIGGDRLRRWIGWLTLAFGLVAVAVVLDALF